MENIELPAEILFQDESLIALAKPAGKSSEDCAFASRVQDPVDLLILLEING
jgi:23S rRNA-/tRNA-specific pseudouridylate synthase